MKHRSVYELRKKNTWGTERKEPMGNFMVKGMKSSQTANCKPQVFVCYDTRPPPPWTDIVEQMMYFQKGRLSYVFPIQMLRLENCKIFKMQGKRPSDSSIVREGRGQEATGWKVSERIVKNTNPSFTYSCPTPAQLYQLWISPQTIL